MKAFKFAVAVVVMVAGMLVARAGPISGNVQFIGTALLDHALPGATAIAFPGSGIVNASSGDLAAMTPLSLVDLALIWPLNTAVPIPAFWTGSGFTFDLTASSIVSQTATFLNVSGTGTLSAAGFDPTPAVFDFTVTSSAKKTELGFAASTSAIPPVVPDNAETILLAGVSLAALILAGRTRIAQKIATV
jgi:hypothetical protein